MGSWKNWQTELAKHCWIQRTKPNILIEVRMDYLEKEREICFETYWSRKGEAILLRVLWLLNLGFGLEEVLKRETDIFI